MDLLFLDITVDQSDYETGVRKLLGNVKPEWDAEDIVIEVSYITMG